MPVPDSPTLLTVDGLEVAFPGPPGGPPWVPVVRGVSFAVGRGEIVGLVGESGSGKTLTALAILRLVPPLGRIRAGRVLLGGEDLLALPERELRRVRGARIGLVFQEPGAALDPVYTVGFQIAEALRAHRRLSRRAARAEAADLLERVAMPDPGRRLGDYPHQLSGGQRQRVMIAIALACAPELLIADEPTTALDVTIQAQILELLERLRAELGLSVLLITHDLAVVAETCDRALVMSAGELVEEAPMADLFARPAHPYTRALLSFLPALPPAGAGEAP
ncbi:MAG TPA: ABC transporter ATP-binding protein [Thermoanaerobaculia bacterium]|nr:ABC transporter ATP-binding protein [Thermoanaerobaculia bacterium]